MELEVKNLEFSYGKKTVLENISFQVTKGEIVGIIGPNGSGKSTLLKCINGLLSPQKGELVLDDKNLLEYSSSDLARTIGYVPQKELLFSPSPVFEIILMGRKPYGAWKPGPEDKEIVARIIHRLNISSIAFQDYSKLSGGQQQKVLIARALAQNPSLLILDEPTSNLDLKHQIEVMEMIKAESKRGISSLIAMHDLSLAARYCHGFIIMKEGRIYTMGGKDIINARCIADVYEVEALVQTENGQPLVIPVGSMNKAINSEEI